MSSQSNDPLIPSRLCERTFQLPIALRLFCMRISLRVSSLYFLLYFLVFRRLRSAPYLKGGAKASARVSHGVFFSLLLYKVFSLIRRHGCVRSGSQVTRATLFHAFVHRGTSGLLHFSLRSFRYGSFLSLGTNYGYATKGRQAAIRGGYTGAAIHDFTTSFRARATLFSWRVSRRYVQGSLYITIRSIGPRVGVRFSSLLLLPELFLSMLLRRKFYAPLVLTCYLR